MPSTLGAKANANVPVHVSLLLLLLIVNAAGILLLFVKSELDVEQIRNEIGLVWREGQLNYVTQNQVSQDTQDIKQDQGAIAQAAPSEEFYAAHSWGVYSHNFSSKPIAIDPGLLRSLTRIFSDSVSVTCDPATVSGCDAATKTKQEAVDLYSVGTWSIGTDHVFYLRVPGDGGPKWYGPFVDDISRLKKEAGQ